LNLNEDAVLRMTKRVRLFMAVSTALSGILAIVPATAIGREPNGWDLLSQGGLVVLIRHAEAPGIGDPPNFHLADCATQRNLDEKGRRQARAIGESFRRRKIPVEKVYSSQWCRCKDTAQLAFGVFEENSALNSFFGKPELKTAQTAAMRALLAQARPSRGNLVLVTHQVNITALTGVVPSPGEMVVAALDGSGRLHVKSQNTAAD